MTDPAWWDLSSTTQAWLVAVATTDGASAVGDVIDAAEPYLGERPIHPSASYHLNALEDRGLVTRTDDGRQRIVRLTDDGAALLDAAAADLSEATA